MQEIANGLEHTNTIILLDEIYADLTFAGPESHNSLAKKLPNQCIVMSGISKSLSAGGYRLGYQVYPPALQHIHKAVQTIASETHSCAPSIIQYAYDHVLRHNTIELAQYQSRCRLVLEGLCKHSQSRLNSSGIRCVESAGAWYLLADFGPHRVALLERGILNAHILCEELLIQAGVAILHDSAFESHTNNSQSPHDFVARISLVDFDGGAALEAAAELSAAGDSVDEEWLTEYCPRVLTGIQRICEFVESDLMAVSHSSLQSKVIPVSSFH
jgi:aspartate/methionine/tyrosine aminotransferase